MSAMTFAEYCCLWQARRGLTITSQAALTHIPPRTWEKYRTDASQPAQIESMVLLLQLLDERAGLEPLPWPPPLAET